MNRIFLVFLVFVSCRVCGQDGFIYTVNGKTSVQNLNLTLTHEHIMSNFGSPPSADSKYDSVALFKQVVPYLSKIKALGVSSIFDCTAAYFGRNVSMLKLLSRVSGIQIITNTGFYGAHNDYYVPDFVKDASVEEIAAIWIAEFNNGIEQTGIKPGFIKLAFDTGIPSEIDIKLFEAGVQTHLQTGLTMVVHTGNNLEAAKEQLKLLKDKKVSGSAWVWAHANQVKDRELLQNAALRGGWISLDGVKVSNVQEYVEMIEFFRSKKLLHKVLLSHDGNSFPRGGAIREYEAIFSALIPELKKRGFAYTEINQLMIKNPQEAFAIKVRLIE